jgi:hypothetical protein
MLGYLSYKFKILYYYSDIKDYLMLLVSIAGAVFTIMGIWIAFAYPNAFLKLRSTENVINADFSENLKDTRRLEGLVLTVIQSIIVISMIAFFFIAKIFFGKLNFYIENAVIIRSLSITYILFASMIQFESLARVVTSNIQFLNELHSRRQKLLEDRDI